ncbi:MAG TPA: TraR/DksA C4-type zinc finger protein [Bryobacteraceae bacterium]|nr:TraR/DksA C4-type zinc finger protein [Bryobacteraceae bacterium]
MLEKQRELTSEIARIESDEEQVAAADSPDVGDRANRAYDKEALFQQLEQARLILVLVREAILRMDAGTFGACVACGGAVEPKRLDAVPWARHCIACQEKQDLGVL